MSKIPFVSGVDMSAEYNAALCLACRFSCADYIVSLSFREKRIEKLFIKQKGLDAKYQEVVDGASQKTLLFGDRFPFRYLVDDYGLSYYVAFVG